MLIIFCSKLPKFANEKKKQFSSFFLCCKKQGPEVPSCLRGKKNCLDVTRATLCTPSRLATHTHERAGCWPARTHAFAMPRRRSTPTSPASPSQQRTQPSQTEASRHTLQGMLGAALINKGHPAAHPAGGRKRASPVGLLRFPKEDRERQDRQGGSPVHLLTSLCSCSCLVATWRTPPKSISDRTQLLSVLHSQSL